MPRGKDESPVIRVYTVCDESRYMIVRNVPALGCGDELSKLFGSYGEIEQCTPMDAEDCEPFTDVYWIKFSQVKSARFAKRKLDESVFLGNKLQVSYAPQFESLADTKEKLEGRRKEVIGRARSRRADASVQHLPAQDPSVSNAKPRDYVKSGRVSHFENASIGHVSSDKVSCSLFCASIIVATCGKKCVNTKIMINAPTCILRACLDLILRRLDSFIIGFPQDPEAVAGSCSHSLLQEFNFPIQNLF